MKKVAILLLMSLTCVSVAIAQTILQGNKFWNGETLYVASIDKKTGNVKLRGADILGNTAQLTLKKVAKKQAEYILVKGDSEPPMGCSWGSRVQYIRQGGMNFLAFYDSDNAICETMVLTPDNIVNCTAQQTSINEEGDPMTLLSNWLMNQHYLYGLHPELLQGMANKLRSIQRKTLIEKTNQQLINFAIDVGFGLPDVEEPVEDEGVENTETSSGEGDELFITVSNEREFLEALGSNRTLRIADGTTLYLTNLLNDEAFFTQQGRLWRNDYYDERSQSKQLIVSCSQFDGRQLDLINMHNLTLRGGRDSHIIVSPRYANVLSFYGCTNIRLENLTLGHTDEGYCQGGVVYAEDSENITIANCDLYGCGTYGVEASLVSNLQLERTVIRDCSYGIMELVHVLNVSFKNCDFVRCRQFDLVSIDDASTGVVFDNCRFAQNQGTLFGNRCNVTLRACEIHHAGDTGLDQAHVNYAGGTTQWFTDNDALPARTVGPTKGE